MTWTCIARPVKVVFLDIDGVLTTPGCYRIASGDRTPADPRCVEALNHIINETGALLVISSTWRFGGIMFCEDKLTEWGVKGKVLDTTPRLNEARGHEIGQWLIDADEDGRYDVRSFVILDDDSDMGNHKARLVQTQGHIGLTMADAERAIEMLGRTA